MSYLIAKLVTVLRKQADGVLFADRKKTKRNRNSLYLAIFIFVGGLILMETFGFYCVLENNKILEKKNLDALGVKYLIQL